MCQGDGIESRVETPFGVSGLFMSGTMRLRPETLELHGFLDGHMGPGNPWGIIFDDFGQAFVCDGAGGISHMTPGTVPTKRRKRLDQIGKPGGYCGIECLDNGEFLLGDYKKNQVSRFVVEEDGAGFKVAWREPILRSKHRNFRPVDVKQGPDGAIYVVDWYNPITCHQDDFYRHPNRDKTHGRIWRISPKTGVDSLPSLPESSVAQLLEHLSSDRRWIRLKAKQALAVKDPIHVAEAARKWTLGKSGRDLVEALGLLAWIESPDAALAERLLQAKDHRVRAYAARVLGRWGIRLPNVHQLLQLAAADPHPLVRMEAMLSAAAIPQAESVLIAATAAGSPRDKWLRYAFAQSVHHLAPHWVPAFKNGTLDFKGNRTGMAAVLAEADSNALLADVRKLVRSPSIDAATSSTLLTTLASLGGTEEVAFVLGASPASAKAIRALTTRDRPDIEAHDAIKAFMLGNDSDLRRAAMKLTAAWRMEDCAEVIAQHLDDGSAERDAAIETLGVLNYGPAETRIAAIAKDSHDPHQTLAIAALLAMNPESAATHAAGILSLTEDGEKIRATLHAFAARESTPELLLTELKRTTITSDQGRRLRDAWVASGLVHAGLASFFGDVAGVSNEPIPFSHERIQALIESAKQGDVARGKELFQSSKAGCAACHRVGKEGGIIGPDLTAVGGGVPADRLVTEVVWPARQVKDGYHLTSLVLKTGEVHQGYIASDREDRDSIRMHDITGTSEITISKESVAHQKSIGSLMPPTAQSLDERELADLLGYLFSLQGDQ